MRNFEMFHFHGGEDRKSQHKQEFCSCEEGSLLRFCVVPCWSHIFLSCVVSLQQTINLPPALTTAP